jgi:hypothetical protein
VLAPVPGAGDAYQNVAIVIRPEEAEVPDKAGVYDTTKLFDLPGIRFIGDALLDLAQENGKDAKVFDFRSVDFNRRLELAGRHLGVADVHPYRLRHGGASEDLLQKRRPKEDIMQRASWVTDASLRRYGNIGKIQSVLRMLSEEHLTFCRWAKEAMPRVLRGQLAPREPTKAKIVVSK